VTTLHGNPKRNYFPRRVRYADIEATRLLNSGVQLLDVHGCEVLKRRHIELGEILQQDPFSESCGYKAHVSWYYEAPATFERVRG
jgi:hypothetical protein